MDIGGYVEMKDTRVVLFLCSAVVFSFWACQPKEQAPKVLPKGVVAVQGTTLRETPANKSKIVTYLSWGEAIEFPGEASEDGKFTKIKLVSDGSEGWVKSYLVKKNAVAGVIATEIESYQRPDPMSRVLQKLAPATMVLVLQTKGDWVEIGGGRSIKNGWVKNKAVSTEKQDVLACKFLDKAARLAKGGKKDEAVKALQKIQQDYSRSKFAQLAQEELAKLTAPEEKQEENVGVEEVKQTEQPIEAE